MSDHPTDFKGDILQAIRDSIVERLPDAIVEANGGGGHFTIAVTSKEFAGKGPVDAQRLVYGAITHLMKGHLAPIHAVDSLKTKVPLAGPLAPRARARSGGEAGLRVCRARGAGAWTRTP